MRHTMGLILCAAALTGCDPHGTCIQQSADLGDSCTVNYRKNPCSNAGGTFYEEEPAAGALRCKGDGFASTMPASEQKAQLDKGEFVMFRKPSKKRE